MSPSTEGDRRAATDLRPAEAEGLAYRELGYSHSGIASQCDVTESTVDGWMGRIAAQYGLAAIESKSTAELDEGLGDLTPVTPEDLHALSTSPGAYGGASVLEQWLAIAEDHRDYVPDGIDLDALAAAVDGGRP